MKTPSFRRSSSRLMLIAVVGLPLLAIALIARFREVGNDRVPWRQDLAAASVVAMAGHKPMLLDFSAEWCPACQEMKRTTWSDRDTAAAITAATVPVHIDIDSHQEIGQRYFINALPTLLLTTSDGHEIRRVEGYQSPEEIQQLLAKK